ncbi:hypothetical protein [Leuconostoc citreum]|uniref:hypothetical protein n=1 Tax=Leuconostoc citreum TaxID=33964 RepID=UPI0032DF290D
MSKIEERHNQELSNIINHLKILQDNYERMLEHQNANSLKNLKELKKQIDAETEKAIVSLDNLSQKNESNYQRKLRYNHVFSLNIHVGKFNRTELENLISIEEPNPEESLINKLDKQNKKDRLASALASLDTVDLIIFKTYQELKYYPGHENWKQLSNALIQKGVKLSDKTVKQRFKKLMKLLHVLVK